MARKSIQERLSNISLDNEYLADHVRLALRRHSQAASNWKRKIEKTSWVIWSNGFRGGKRYFITLTYDEKYIKLSLNAKNKAFEAFLNDNTTSYIGNNDLGTKNGRFHHHALIHTDLTELELKDKWIYGFSDFREVIGSVDNIKTKQYVTKLTNHSLKNDTERIRVRPYHDKNIVAFAFNNFNCKIDIEY